jgi:hypothetical protein
MKVSEVRQAAKDVMGFRWVDPPRNDRIKINAKVTVSSDVV